MDRAERIERRRIRRLRRRAVREHRAGDVYLHSVKLVDWGEASVWGYWGCPRCRGVLAELRGEV